MDYKEQFYNMVKQYGKLIPYYVLQLLVGGWPTPLKNMSLSVGMMKFPTEWKNNPFMFQTTTQVLYWYCTQYITVMVNGCKGSWGIVMDIDGYCWIVTGCEGLW